MITQKESLSGKFEVYSRDGIKIISDDIQADEDPYDYVEPLFVPQVWDDAEQLLKSLGVKESIDRQLKVAYRQIKVPRYW